MMPKFASVQTIASIKERMTATGNFPSTISTKGMILALCLYCPIAASGIAVIKEGGSGGTIIATLATATGVSPTDELLVPFNYKSQLHVTLSGAGAELYIYVA